MRYSLGVNFVRRLNNILNELISKYPTLSIIASRFKFVVSRRSLDASIRSSWRYLDGVSPVASLNLRMNVR